MKKGEKTMPKGQRIFITTNKSRPKRKDFISTRDLPLDPLKIRTVEEEK